MSKPGSVLVTFVNHIQMRKLNSFILFTIFFSCNLMTGVKQNDKMLIFGSLPRVFFYFYLMAVGAVLSHFDIIFGT